MVTLELDRTSPRWRLLARAGVMVTLTTSVGAAQGFDASAPRYEEPPPEIVRLVDTPLLPSVRLSPDRTFMVLLEQPSLPSISELAEPELRLAGMRIKPRTFERSRTRPASGLTVTRLDDLGEIDITGLPATGLRISHLKWAADGRRFAFVTRRPEGLDLWVVDLTTSRARRLVDGRLSETMGTPYYWLSDSATLICRTRPRGQGPAPEKPAVPEGPVIEEHVGSASPARTYQDLLESPYDEQLFEYYFTSEIVRIDLATDESRVLGEGIIRDLSPSPNGSYLLVGTIHPPFSYQVPASYFPRRIEIWDVDGNVVTEVVDLPLHEGIPTAYGSVPTGPRAFRWRHDALATLVWAEAQDGGDAGRPADIRDRVYLYPAPFEGEPVELMALGYRFAGIMWGDDDLALVNAYWWKTRTSRTWVVKPGIPSAAPRLLFELSWEDRYGDPGDPMTRWNENGRSVLVTADDGAALYLSGKGASPEGDRPFLDRLDLISGESERLWRSEPPYLERAVTFIDAEAGQLLTRRESRTEPPNYVVRGLHDGGLRPITSFSHPAPQLVGVQKELVRYRRADGVDLTARLYLPPDYTPEDGPLPMLMWVYPKEYKSAAAAGQVTDSPHRFDRIYWSSPLIWLTQGYAVLQSPSLPIIGEGDAEPNDTYVEQLVAGAQAAVDEVVGRGVADPERIVIGGHSYGAFTAANLLAHSDLFCAGIARSGAYNRTLTPFGFQAEERTIWAAPEVYRTMSPFNHADALNEPILLIHGEVDSNMGTYPLQSERFYAAVKGLGGTARLVVLPYESHGYRARESVLHVLWEMNEWMRRYAVGDDVSAEGAGAGDVGGIPTPDGSRPGSAAIR